MAFGLSALWKLAGELQLLQSFELGGTPVQRQSRTVLVGEDSDRALGGPLTLASQCPSPEASPLVSALRRRWYMPVFTTRQRYTPVFTTLQSKGGKNT